MSEAPTDQVRRLRIGRKEVRMSLRIRGLVPVLALVLALTLVAAG